MIYDIIGDIHGQADKLLGLLDKLGYQHDGVSHIAPHGHQAVFIGDLIDRGNQQLKTLKIVFDMIDNQQAQAVMGNHEYNAIGYATKNALGERIYQPTPRQHEVHQVFLQEVQEGSALHQYWLQRFFELPLWLEFDDCMIIHACPDGNAMARLHPYLQNQRLNPQTFTQLPKAVHADILKILTGVQARLPDEFFITDGMGHPRKDIRVQWWQDDLHQPITTLSAASNCDLSTLPNDLICPIDFQLYTDKPIIIGHYWLTGTPTPLSDQVICTDYSAGKDGYLTAYRFDSGNPTISRDNFVQFYS